MRGWNDPKFRGVLGLVVVTGVAIALAAAPGTSAPAGAAAATIASGSSIAAAAALRSRAAEAAPVSADSQVLRGRYLVVTHICGGCHGGDDDPGRPGWLAGVEQPEQVFEIGPCAEKPGAEPCFHTYPRNLTPDNDTGLGRFTERQIFNSLRYGLRPEDTPDVDITSTTPGQGNFPLHPHYLAPPMPWMSWRHMPDADLWAIAAYLKHGLKPVHNLVKESEGPPDFWAGFYGHKGTLGTPGPYPTRPFPTENEQGGD